MLEWVADHPFLTGYFIVAGTLAAVTLFGPLLPYRYRRKVIINASREEVWRAIDIFAADAQSTHPDRHLTQLDPSRVLSEPVDGATGGATEYELVDRVVGESLTYRLSRVHERSGVVKDAPHGTDSFETLEIKDAWTGFTWLHYSARFRFRTPLEALLFRGAISLMLEQYRHFCESGEKWTTATQNRLKNSLLFILAFASAIILLGPVTGVMFFSMLIVHEIGHAVALMLVGEKVQRVHFIPFFGVAMLGSRPKTALRSAIVYLGGVIFSWPPIILLIIAAVLFGGSLNLEALLGDELLELDLSNVCYGLAAWGIFLNLTQLIPAPFFGGGRVIETMISGSNRRKIVGLFVIAGLGTSLLLFALQYLVFGTIALVFSLSFLHLIREPAVPPISSTSRAAAVGIFGIYAGQWFLYSVTAMFLIQIMAAALPVEGVDAPNIRAGEEGGGAVARSERTRLNRWGISADPERADFPVPE